MPPRTPLPRAANIRSVHTDADTHTHRRGSSGADSGLAVACTIAPVSSFCCIDLNLSYLPSCPPSLGAGLLTALFRYRLCPNLRNLFVFSVYRLVSRRCHPIGSIIRASSTLQYYEGSDSYPVSPHWLGLPAYLVTPAHRSTSNHTMQPLGHFNSHLSAHRVFRTSPSPSKLVTASCRIEFVILRTDDSPPIAPHPVS